MMGTTNSPAQQLDSKYVRVFEIVSRAPSVDPQTP
jgi:hypothetical protein